MKIARTHVKIKKASIRSSSEVPTAMSTPYTFFCSLNLNTCYYQRLELILISSRYNRNEGGATKKVKKRSGGETDRQVKKASGKETDDYHVVSTIKLYKKFFVYHLLQSPP